MLIRFMKLRHNGYNLSSKYGVTSSRISTQVVILNNSATHAISQRIHLPTTAPLTTPSVPKMSVFCRG